MVITVKKLGLAAFVKMKGGKLLKFGREGYTFDVNKSEAEIEIEYLNSCCYQHDQQVMSLRSLKDDHYG